tara:strand:+ start:63 stop:593 length:531 start_codon:yes stop_codon:yes gene_type:complete
MIHTLEVKDFLDSTKTKQETITNYINYCPYSTEDFAIQHLQHKFPQYIVIRCTKKHLKKYPKLTTLNTFDLLGVPDIVMFNHKYEIISFYEIKLGQRMHLYLNQNQLLWIQKYHTIYPICLLGIIDYRNHNVCATIMLQLANKINYWKSKYEILEHESSSAKIKHSEQSSLIVSRH